MLNRVFNYLHPSYCFYALVWGIITGIIFSLIFKLRFITNPLFLLVALIIFLISLHYSSIPLMAAMFLAGMLLGNFRLQDQLTSQELIASLENQTVIIAGKISEDPDTSKTPPVIRLKEFRIYPADQSLDQLATSTSYVSVTGTLYVTLSSQADLERSDFVFLQGKLSGGFGTFVGKISRAKLLQFERTTTGDIFAKFKQWFAKRIREYLPSPEANLGLGYLMGMKTGLPEDFAEALQAVGMTHVVVASGAHLAILVGAAKKLFGKLSKFAGLLAALLLIFVFVMIVGFTPSMTRAALVASLSLLVGYVGRKFTPFRLIGFVAMLTLLFEPTFFLNLGWQLSFASFFGILVVAPRLTASFYGGKTPPWLASMLITSISTSLICAPILIYNFGSLSLLSLIANLIILPTLPYAMLLMMLTGVFGFIPFLATIIARPTLWLLDLHIFIINFLSEQTTFILTFPSADWKIYLLYIPVLLFLLLSSKKLRLTARFRPQSQKLHHPSKTI